MPATPVTKHDVIAFLTHLAEHVGSDEARFVHQGMTSSDVLDTCFNVQLTRAADILIADVDALLAALKKRAMEHKDTLRVGRSHGIHAEPTTMGLTFARFYAEMDRNKTRLITAREEISTGASRHWAWWPPASRTSPPKSATCSARRFWKARSSSPWAKKARRPCRIRRTRSSPKTSLVWLAPSAWPWSPRWKT